MCKTHKSLHCVGWLSLNLFVGKNSLVVLEKIIFNGDYLLIGTQSFVCLSEDNQDSNKRPEE